MKHTRLAQSMQRATRDQLPIGIGAGADWPVIAGPGSLADFLWAEFECVTLVAALGVNARAVRDYWPVSRNAFFLMINFDFNFCCCSSIC